MQKKISSETNAATPRDAAGTGSPAIPRVLTAGEISLCITVDRDGQGATVCLMPMVRAVERILTDTYGQYGWCSRHYACGGAIYCGIGVDHRGTFVYRDAVETDGSAGQSRSSASFIAAAALWGVGAGVLDLPVCHIGKNRCAINPVAGRDGRSIAGYVLADTLALEKIAYDDAGGVTAYQLRNKAGEAILWQKT